MGKTHGNLTKQQVRIATPEFSHHDLHLKLAFILLLFPPRPSLQAERRPAEFGFLTGRSLCASSTLLLVPDLYHVHEHIHDHPSYFHHIPHL